MALLQIPSSVVIKTQLEFHLVSVRGRFMIEITRIIHLSQAYRILHCWTVTSHREATCSKEIGEEQLDGNFYHLDTVVVLIDSCLSSACTPSATITPLISNETRSIRETMNGELVKLTLSRHISSRILIF